MTLTTLDEICNDFQIILLDASAINNFLECKSAHSVKLKERINYKSEEKDSAIFFRKYINKKNNFLMTDLVFNELNYNNDHNNNSSIRGILSKYDFLKISKKEHEYYHEVCSHEKEKNKLLKTIKKNGKILNFNQDEKERYANYFERNFYLKSKNNLSDPDYDLLISGAVLCAKRGNTALLSNDFPLLYSYKSLIFKEKLCKEQYGFFIRPKRKFFQEAYNNL